MSTISVGKPILCRMGGIEARQPPSMFPPGSCGMSSSEQVTTFLLGTAYIYDLVRNILQGILLKKSLRFIKKEITACVAGVIELILM